MSTSIFCVSKTYAQASAIIGDLRDSGFPLSEISVVCPDLGGKYGVDHVVTSKAPEGISAGVAAGGVAGGVLGLLMGIGALAIPGLGPFIAAGPVMGALSGAAAGAAAGGLVGGLVGLGIPEIEARRYESRLRTGNYLISVHTKDANDDDKAERIFQNHGAEDIVATTDRAVPQA